MKRKTSLANSIKTTLFFVATSTTISSVLFLLNIAFVILTIIFQCGWWILAALYALFLSYLLCLINFNIAAIPARQRVMDQIKKELLNDLDQDG